MLARYPAPARVGVFVLLLLLRWLPILGGLTLLVSDLNLRSILTILALYVEFLLLTRWWWRRVYQQPRSLWRYGLEFTRRAGQEWLIGLAIGAASLFALFACQSLLGWLTWQAPSPTFARIFLEGLLVAAAYGFAEELLFRGWLLDELQRDYSPPIALWANAAIFALLHFRLLQFPALLLLGIALVWAKRVFRDSPAADGTVRERLALPMGLHAGLIWGYYLVNVGQLVQYLDRVPVWVTGIDRNPLVGLMGLLFLTLLAAGLRSIALRRSASHRG